MVSILKVNAIRKSNGKVEVAHIMIKNSNDEVVTITLERVSYIPNFWTNIVSITTEIDNDKSELGNKGKVMTLTNPKTKVTLEFWNIFP